MFLHNQLTDLLRLKLHWQELQTQFLQPPIQAKYKDDYLFFDTLTKMPLPNKLERLLDKKEITLTQDQIEDYMKLFMKLKMNCDGANDEANDPSKGREDVETVV